MNGSLLQFENRFNRFIEKNQLVHVKPNLRTCVNVQNVRGELNLSSKGLDFIIANVAL